MWLLALYRYNPLLKVEGRIRSCSTPKNRLAITKLFLMSENRYTTMLKKKTLSRTMPSSPMPSKTLWIVTKAIAGMLPKR